MEILKTFIWVANIISAIVLITLVLMQHGKGADAGAAFGSGSAQGVFGAAGSSNFLSRSTAIIATLFFATCLGLGYLSTNQGSRLNLQDGVKPAVEKVVTPKPKPVTPSSAIPE